MTEEQRKREIARLIQVIQRHQTGAERAKLKLQQLQRLRRK